MEDLFKQIFAEAKEEQALEFIPQDEWTHKKDLISLQELQKEKLNETLSKELTLGYIRDDRLLTILKERWLLCVLSSFHLYQKTKNSGIRELFQYFYGDVLSTLRFSRNKDGFERKLQANLQADVQKPRGLGILKPKQEKQGIEKEEFES